MNNPIPPFVRQLRTKLSEQWRDPRGRLWLSAGAGLIVAFLILVIYSLVAARQQYHRGVRTVVVSPTASATPSPTATPTPALSPSLLDGIQVPTAEAALRPLAVMIENSPDARPQSGLGSASLVYEALVEGGITRFMAVYRNPQEAVKVGPVRSARIYFVDYVSELGAFYAHVGGNDHALAQINSTGVLDLDQFKLGTAAYHREARTGVATEHTMYASTDLLWKYATEHNGWSNQATFSPWNFTDDIPATQRPASASATISVSGPDYKVQWSYDPATNTYRRTMAGISHKDANTDNQIAVKNVVIQIVTKADLETIPGHGTALTLGTTGEGKATILQNGSPIAATWKKSGTGRTRYYKADGTEISFIRGSTWIELADSGSTVTQ